MKKHTTPANHARTLLTLAHFLIMVLGVLTAVICSFVLLESASAHQEQQQNHFEFPASHLINKSIDVSSFHVTVSALGNLRSRAM